jgi:A/G-specific adenine glycosylase
VLTYYRSEGRNFPWRYSRIAYRIVVSEFMLQQTQTARVSVYFPRFLRRFPSLKSLAEAPLKDVLTAWQGLGYNRRAKFLHQLAQEVRLRHHGRLPSDPDKLQTLPGIGSYTAAAIAVFAFNKPYPMIETNIRSVYLHHFFPKEGAVSDAVLLNLIEQSMYKENPREWFYALMDYGAMLKARGNTAHRRSAHYRPQTTFHGSPRQMRGQVLRCLLTHKEGLSLRDMSEALAQPKARINTALEALRDDGLIVMWRGKYLVQ